MKIKVLGCHGSDMLLETGGTTHQCRSVGFLINDVLMVDAGTGASELTLDEQKRIRHVVFSHLHLDHVKGLPPLVDNLAAISGDPMTLASIPQVLNGLRNHIFNDQVFPNFFALPTRDKPILKDVVLPEGQETWLSGIGFTPVKVNHSVPTVGFIIRDNDSSWLYSGDTYETHALWEMAAKVPNLKAAFIETSFPDEMKELASIAKHLTPSLLAQEFKKIGRPDLPLYVYHLKPPFRDQITDQLSKLGIPNLTILQEGQELEI
ncbi:MAG: 3',5'-cyclic-nucleotide phosphodiesterase [Nitrospirota bacterium]|nr:3',5'-cyclic-nucleotide phosphodiesterase [Nitrospirota bacterium]